MNVKEILNKIKAAFDVPIVPTTPTVPVTIEAKNYKLKDGSAIEISQAGDLVAVGDMVTAGGALPIPGTYELEDGTIITVDATGKVTDVKLPEALEEEIPQPGEPTLEQRIAILESELVKLKTPAIPEGMVTESQLQAESQKIEDQNKIIAKHEETIKGLFELVEKLIQEPTADPVTLTGSKKERFERLEERDEKRKKYADILKNKKVLV